MSSFCLNTVSDGRKQTGLPDAGDNLRKSHFIMCHVTKYSTIRGAYQQPWPGVSPTAILNEEKALGTRLPGLKYDLGHAHRLSCECKKVSCGFFPPNFKHCVRAKICKKIWARAKIRHVIGPLVCSLPEGKQTANKVRIKAQLPRSSSGSTSSEHRQLRQLEAYWDR